MRIDAVVVVGDDGTREPVVRVLVASGEFGRVLVVRSRSPRGSDPRRDHDAIRLQSMLAGARASTAAAVAFFAGNLSGLMPEHTRALLAPLRDGDTLMACGLPDDGPTYRQVWAACPLFTGACVVHRLVLLRLDAARSPKDFHDNNHSTAERPTICAVTLRGLKTLRPMNIEADRSVRITTKFIMALHDAHAALAHMSVRDLAAVVAHAERDHLRESLRDRAPSRRNQLSAEPASTAARCPRR